VRILALLAIAGCSFTGSTETIGDGMPAAKDASKDGATPIDAKLIDAKPIDAKQIDAAAIAVRFVQGNGALANASSFGSVSFPALESAGDLDVVGVSWASSNITVMSVRDSDGNTYTRIGSPIAIMDVGTLAMYYAPNIRQGTSTNIVTVTFSSATNPVIVIAEYAGLAQTSPLDVTSSATGDSTTAASGFATTTHPHELLVGIAASTKGLSAGTGFTTDVPAVLDLIEAREVTTAGNYEATATLSSTGIWLIGIAGFVAAD
jgi:hypothetical protein